MMTYDPGPKQNLPEQEPKSGKGTYPLIALLLAALLLAPAAQARSIQDGPDTFPTDGEECQGAQYWRWTARGPVLVCAASRPITDDSDPWRTEEQTSVEVFTLDPPEADPVVLPFLCTDSSNECQIALLNGCSQHMRRTVVALDALNYDSAERTCKGRCPDGTRITCEVQEVNPKPKPKPPPGPGEV
jgi:hypothetical protein